MDTKQNAFARGSEGLDRGKDLKLKDLIAVQRSAVYVIHLDVDCLVLGVVLHRRQPVLPAHSGHLVAAEGQLRGGQVEGVDVS